MSGFECLNPSCGAVFELDEADKEYVDSMSLGGPCTRYHCPDCMGRDGHGLQECAVCRTCLGAKAEEGYDDCKVCGRHEEADAHAHIAEQALCRRRDERRKPKVIIARPRQMDSMLREIEQIRKETFVTAPRLRT